MVTIDKTWIEDAINKGFSRLQIKKKLEKAEFETEEIRESLEYYDKKYLEKIKEEKEKEKYEDDKEFRSEYTNYLIAKERKLTWKEKRKYKDCIKFEKNIKKLIKTTLIFLGEINKEKNKIKEKFSKDRKKQLEELEDIRKELIEKILEDRPILEIYHPQTGEEINEENIQTCTYEELIEIMKSELIDLNLFVNGKV